MTHLTKSLQQTSFGRGSSCAHTLNRKMLVALDCPENGGAVFLMCSVEGDARELLVEDRQFSWRLHTVAVAIRQKRWRWVELTFLCDPFCFDTRKQLKVLVWNAALHAPTSPIRLLLTSTYFSPSEIICEEELRKSGRCRPTLADFFETHFGRKLSRLC